MRAFSKQHLPWEEAYKLAILEEDRVQRHQQIKAARCAIFSRVEELGDMEDAKQELSAIQYALKYLDLVERESQQETTN